MESAYTTQQRSDAQRLYNALQRVPPDQGTILKVMANTYINGMKDQAGLLAEQTAREREGRECSQGQRVKKPPRRGGKEENEHSAAMSK